MHQHPLMEQPVRRPGVARYVAGARHWWPVVLIPALLGAMFGVWSSVSSPYSSTVLLRVNAAGPQVGDAELAAQTALRIIDSDEVFNRAREVLGASGVGLRARTDLARITDTDLLSVQVSAPTAEQAAREVATVTAAGLETVQKLAQQQFEAIDQTGTRALVDGVLDDSAAELARLQALGAVAANRQDAALAAALLLTQVGEPQAAYQAGLPPSTAGMIGLLACAVPGVAGAVLYGRRFGHVRRPADVLEALPRAEVYGRRGITRVAGRCASGQAPLVGILAVPGATPELADLTAFLETEFRSDNRHPFVLQTSVLQTSAVGAPAESAPTRTPRAADSPERAVPEPVAAATARRRGPRPRPAAGDAPTDGPAGDHGGRDAEPALNGSASQGLPPAPRNGVDGIFTVAVEDTVKIPPSRRAPTSSRAVGWPHAAPSLGRHRERDLAALGCDVLVVSGEYAPDVAARLAGRSDAVILIARRGRTRLRHLIRAGRDLEATNLAVVLT